MRIDVDLLKCESNGLCMSQAPEIFQIDDDDVLHVLMTEPDESLRPKIQAAVKMCPKQALTLID